MSRRPSRSKSPTSRRYGKDKERDFRDKGHEQRFNTSRSDDRAAFDYDREQHIRGPRSWDARDSRKPDNRDPRYDARYDARDRREPDRRDPSYRDARDWRERDIRDPRDWDERNRREQERRDPRYGDARDRREREIRDPRDWDERNSRDRDGERNRHRENRSHHNDGGKSKTASMDLTFDRDPNTSSQSTISSSPRKAVKKEESNDKQISTRKNSRSRSRDRKPAHYKDHHQLLNANPQQGKQISTFSQRKGMAVDLIAQFQKNSFRLWQERKQLKKSERAQVIKSKGLSVAKVKEIFLRSKGDSKFILFTLKTFVMGLCFEGWTWKDIQKHSHEQDLIDLVGSRIDKCEYSPQNHVSIFFSLAKLKPEVTLTALQDKEDQRLTKRNAEKELSLKEDKSENTDIFKKLFQPLLTVIQDNICRYQAKLTDSRLKSTSHELRTSVFTIEDAYHCFKGLRKLGADKAYLMASGFYQSLFQVLEIAINTQISGDNRQGYSLSHRKYIKFLECFVEFKFSKDKDFDQFSLGQKLLLPLNTIIRVCASDAVGKLFGVLASLGYKRQDLIQAGIFKRLVRAYHSCTVASINQKFATEDYIRVLNSLLKMGFKKEDFIRDKDNPNAVDSRQALLEVLNLEAIERFSLVEIEEIFYILREFKFTGQEIKPDVVKSLLSRIYKILNLPRSLQEPSLRSKLDVFQVVTACSGFGFSKEIFNWGWLLQGLAQDFTDFSAKEIVILCSSFIAIKLSLAELETNGFCQKWLSLIRKHFGDLDPEGIQLLNAYFTVEQMRPEKLDVVPTLERETKLNPEDAQKKYSANNVISAEQYAQLQAENKRLMEEIKKFSALKEGDQVHVVASSLSTPSKAAVVTKLAAQGAESNMDLNEASEIAPAVSPEPLNSVSGAEAVSAQHSAISSEAQDDKNEEPHDAPLAQKAKSKKLTADEKYQFKLEDNGDLILITNKKIEDLERHILRQVGKLQSVSKGRALVEFGLLRKLEHEGHFLRYQRIKANNFKINVNLNNFGIKKTNKKNSNAIIKNVFDLILKLPDDRGADGVQSKNQSVFDEAAEEVRQTLGLEFVPLQSEGWHAQRVVPSSKTVEVGEFASIEHDEELSTSDKRKKLSTPEQDSGSEISDGENNDTGTEVDTEKNKSAAKSGVSLKEVLPNKETSNFLFQKCFDFNTSQIKVTLFNNYQVKIELQGAEQRKEHSLLTSLIRQFNKFSPMDPELSPLFNPEELVEHSAHCAYTMPKSFLDKCKNNEKEAISNFFRIFIGMKFRRSGEALTKGFNEIRRLFNMPPIAKVIVQKKNLKQPINNSSSAVQQVFKSKYTKSKNTKASRKRKREESSKTAVSITSSSAGNASSIMNVGSMTLSIVNPPQVQPQSQSQSQIQPQPQPPQSQVQVLPQPQPQPPYLDPMNLNQILQLSGVMPRVVLFNPPFPSVQDLPQVARSSTIPFFRHPPATPTPASTAPLPSDLPPQPPHTSAEGLSHEVTPLPMPVLDLQDDSLRGSSHPISRGLYSSSALFKPGLQSPVDDHDVVDDFATASDSYGGHGADHSATARDLLSGELSPLLETNSSDSVAEFLRDDNAVTNDENMDEDNSGFQYGQ